MKFNDPFIDNLYANLKALSKSAFPKHCNNCGQVFETEADFIQKTTFIQDHSGLKACVDENEQPMVELFRNCTCGSTLLDFFNDRRDLSEKGVKRREVFEKLLVMLEKKGAPRTKAREEILKFMRGQNSPLLSEMGIRHKNKDQ
ncbi:MAG: oxidoreductase [Thermodesulfobacteriota bacterium]|nr:oxidoreductase [Thermodesulfobacteriota bacterium]